MVFVITCQSVSDFRRHSRGGGGEAQFTYTHLARLQYFAHCSKAAGLVSLHRHCVKNRPRQASLFCIVDFETAVCFWKEFCYLYEKHPQANGPADAWILNLKEKRRVPTLGTLLRKHYIMDIERPVVLGRNESNECQNRNSILLLYVQWSKCQAFCPAGYPSFCGGFFFFNLADNSNPHIILATPFGGEAHVDNCLLSYFMV